MSSTAASLEARTGTSRWQTAMNFIKCCVGAGSFSLPYAFIQGGLVASVVLCLCIGSLAAYTIVLLGWIEEHAWSRLTAQQQQRQMARHAGHKGLSYPAIGRIVAPHWVCPCSKRGGPPHLALAPPLSTSTATAAATSGGTEHFQQLAAENEHAAAPSTATPPDPNAGGVHDPPHAGPCNIMSTAIATAIVATSVGVGAAYLDFIASTLVSIFPASGLGQTEFMLLTLLPVLPLAMVTSYKYLAYTSVLGDIAVAAGIVVVVLFGAFGQSDSSQSTSAGGEGGGNGTVAVTPLAPGEWEDGDAPLFDPTGVFKVVGSVAFLFAVHIVVLPVVQSMKERAAFGTVVYSSMGGVAVTNTVFGVVCAVLFASLTQPNVIDNLDDGPVSVTVKVLLCIDLLFTVPMVLAAGRQVLERGIMSRYRHERKLRKAVDGKGGVGGVPPPAVGAARRARSASQSLIAEHEKEQGVQHEKLSTSPPTSSDQAAAAAPVSASAGAVHAPPPPTETAPLRAGGAGAGALAPQCGREAFIAGLVRFSLVLVMAAAALSIPNFEMMVTLVGGLINSFTGFVFPPLLFLALTHNCPGYKPSVWSTIGHSAIAVFGVMAAVLTTTFTIRDMLE